jgi:hypothetical protein
MITLEGAKAKEPACDAQNGQWSLCNFFSVVTGAAGVCWSEFVAAMSFVPEVEQISINAEEPFAAAIA